MAICFVRYVDKTVTTCSQLTSLLNSAILILDFELAPTRVSTSRPSNPGHLLQAVVGRRGPGIPDELMATMVLATSVRLTWRAPADNTDSITGYMVYWQEDSIQRLTLRR